MMNLNQKFLLEIARIKEPEIFLGVARVLKVKIMNEEKKEPKSFETLLEECMESFEKMGRNRRKELIKILKIANKTPAPKSDTSANMARELLNSGNSTSSDQTAAAPSVGGEQNAD